MANTVDVQKPDISTHTPLAGRDGSRPDNCPECPISTHTPLAGRDETPLKSHYRAFQFQLTRPSRGATRDRPAVTATVSFQLTRPSRGATELFRGRARAHHFNSHAPRGARRQCENNLNKSILFQLTRPSRGATSACKIQ